MASWRLTFGRILGACLAVAGCVGAAGVVDLWRNGTDLPLVVGAPALALVAAAALFAQVQGTRMVMAGSVEDLSLTRGIRTLGVTAIVGTIVFDVGAVLVYVLLAYFHGP